MLLDTIAQILRHEKYQKEIIERETSVRKLQKHNLAQINLTSALSRNARNLCGNAPVTLVPNNLPKTIWLKYLAHYLAISSRKYPDYGNIAYDDDQLINNAEYTQH